MLFFRCVAVFYLEWHVVDCVYLTENLCFKVCFEQFSPSVWSICLFVRFVRPETVLKLCMFIYFSFQF